MKTYFHGTTKEQLDNMKEGECKEIATWTCSDDEMLYLWDFDKIIESNGFDEDEEQYARDTAIRQAFESAEITASMQGVDTELIVIELVLNEDDVMDDESCENMASEASCIHFDDVDLNNAIVTEYRCKFNGYKSPYIISNLLGRIYFNEFYIEDGLREFAEQLQGQDIYLETEFDFVEYPIVTNLTSNELNEVTNI